MVANLDEEDRYRSSPPTAQHSSATYRALAVAGSLLRIHATDGAQLWLPAPLSPERCPPIAGVSTVSFEVGRPTTFERADYWWMTPIEDTERAAAVARALPRPFAHECARAAGRVLPGSSVIDADAVTALEWMRVLREAATHSTLGCWVVKPSYTAAGRDQIRGSSDPDSGDASAAWQRLRGRGTLVVEPWMERLADFGAVGSVDDNGAIALVGLHELLVDAAGRFRGIRCARDPMRPPSLTPNEVEPLEATFAMVGGRLADLGFRGPFGIDAYRYRGHDDQIHFHPLCEINPRTSFGRITRTWVDGWIDGTIAADAPPAPDAEVFELRFGRATRAHDETRARTPSLTLVEARSRNDGWVTLHSR
ncbi:MAG: hypothetical protein KDC38_15490 [Planctomycetes bacterium]|nr:hypothetical protein [Planctomycetota bacterium]